MEKAIKVKEFDAFRNDMFTVTVRPSVACWRGGFSATVYSMSRDAAYDAHASSAEDALLEAVQLSEASFELFKRVLPRLRDAGYSLTPAALAICKVRA